MTATDVIALVVLVGLGLLVVWACAVVAWNRWATFDAAKRGRAMLRHGVVHNVVAHPLLVLCPRLGRWVHERSKPLVPTIAGRRELRRLPHGAVLDEDGWHYDPPRAASRVVVQGWQRPLIDEAFGPALAEPAQRLITDVLRPPAPPSDGSHRWMFTPDSIDPTTPACTVRRIGRCRQFWHRIRRRP